MTDFDVLRKKLDCSEEELDLKIEDFLEYAQVQLANLEDAIDALQYSKMIKASRLLLGMAETLHLDAIIWHAGHIKLLATFKRNTDYRPIFNDLRQSTKEVYDAFRLKQEMLTC